MKKSMDRTLAVLMWIVTDLAILLAGYQLLK